MNIRMISLSALAALALGGCATPDSPVMNTRDIKALRAENLTEKAVFERPDGYRLNYRIHEPRTSFLRKYPLVLFLHGAGERGDDNTSTLVHGVTPICRYALNHGDAYVVVPQCPKDKWWASSGPDAEPTPQMEAVLALVDDLVAKYPIDRSRIYVTGISMGGFGTWEAAARRPDLFAAIMPICGGVDPANAERYRGMNISFFHGSNDDLVNVDYSRRMDKALTEKGIAHTYKEYPGVKHDSWTRTYDDSKVLAWMFGCRK